MTKLPFALILLCLSLTACKDQSEASAILPKACKSFPNTTIYKFDKRILWVQTKVDGISASVADTMFKQACQDASLNLGKIKINIQTELNFDGRQALIVGFRQFYVVWPVRNGVDLQVVPVGYQVMTGAMLSNWFTQHLGYCPTPAQIQVVTEQDAENTPKGEPMQTQTLAELQAAKRAKIVQQVQDYTKEQQLLQNP